MQQVQVIEEAIKYIDSLHVALFQRLRAQELAVESSKFLYLSVVSNCMETVIDGVHFTHTQ